LPGLFAEMNHFAVSGYNEFFGKNLSDFLKSCQFQFGVSQFCRNCSGQDSRALLKCRVSRRDPLSRRCAISGTDWLMETPKG
jgi:hypothetical protein